MKQRERLYRIWGHMLDRCRNPNNDSYKYYGGVGVKVCKEWENYKCFKAWAIANGYREDLTIDRINVYGNYEPSNCRWADMKTQNNNRRNSRYLEYKGECRTIAEWAKKLNIPYRTIHHRLERGYSIGAALGLEVGKKLRPQTQKKVI
jgi:hypothetical protein